MKKIAIVVFCMLGSVYVTHASEFDSVMKAKANNPIPYNRCCRPGSGVPMCFDCAEAHYKNNYGNNTRNESSQRELSRSQELKRCP